MMKNRRQRKKRSQQKDGNGGGGGVVVPEAQEHDEQHKFVETGAVSKRTTLRKSISTTLYENSARLGIPVDHVQEELFDWTGPIEGISHMEPLDVGIVVILRTALEVEKFILFGMLLCADSLLYCFSFLPLKAVYALVAFFRTGFQLFFPRHVFALIQGSILVLVCVLLEVIELDNLQATRARIEETTTWTRLHTLFALFAALDALMDKLGVRITGHLAWSVQNRQSRLLMCVLSTGYVLIHSAILTLQISVFYSVQKSLPDLMGFLLLVKLTASDITKALSMNTSITKEDILGSCRNDILQRFKWVVFLLVTAVSEVSAGTFDRKDVISLLLTYSSVCGIDLLKHGFFALLSEHKVTPETYQKMRFEFTTCFVHVPKLGLTDTSYKSVFAKQFEFQSIPFTAIIIRELWSSLMRINRSNALVFWLLFCGFVLAKIAARLLLRSYARSVHVKKDGTLHPKSTAHTPIHLHHRKKSVSVFNLMMQATLSNVSPTSMQSIPSPTTTKLNTVAAATAVSVSPPHGSVSSISPNPSPRLRTREQFLANSVSPTSGRPIENIVEEDEDEDDGESVDSFAASSTGSDHSSSNYY